MANLPKGQGVVPMPPFMDWLSTNIPAVYDNTMSYYDELTSLIKYLQDSVVPALNADSEAITVLSNFVEHYFDNLDVQEEINNKLDQMAEDGTLQEIITEYIQANVAWTFDTVADMKLATNLISGSYAQTLGFYSINDGGGAVYYITDTGTANEMDCIAVGSLYANLVHLPNYINVKTVGCKSGVSSFDNSTIINTMALQRTTLFFPYGEYYIANPIVLTANHITLKGENERTRIIKNTGNGFDLTIETSKGTTYNFNNIDTNIYVGKNSSAASTVSLVKIENISLQCYDSTNTGSSYAIFMLGCGYLKTNNIQLVDYNRGIFADDCFACNLDYITALTFGENRNAIEIKDSTAMYITNSYLSGRYQSILADGSRVYVDKVACESHGQVFSAINASYMSIINSRCETYATDFNVQGASQLNVTNCDIEGHGSEFTQFMRVRNNSKVNVKNSLFRYQYYGEGTQPATITGFTMESNSIVNCECYLNIQDGTTITNSLQSSCDLWLIDLNIDGKHATLTPETGVTLTDKKVYVKDGYVNVYLTGNTTNAMTQGSSANICTISDIPIPSGTAHRFLLGTGTSNLYSDNKPAYGGISNGGVISITPAEESQKYFVINTKYKI